MKDNNKIDKKIARLYNPLSDEEILEHAKKTLQEYIKESTHNKICNFNMLKYLHQCHALQCSEKIKNKIISMAHIELYEYTKEGNIVIINGTTKDYKVMEKRIGESLIENNYIAKERLTVETRKTLRLIVRYERKFIFQLEETVTKSYYDDTGKKTGGASNTKQIRIFEIGELWTEYDVFSESSKYIFKNIRYFISNRGYNEKQLITDTIQNIVNYISTDAMKRIKEVDYDCIDEIVHVVKVICDSRIRYKTSVYGIISEDKKYLPTQYELIADAIDEKIKAYEEMFKGDINFEILPEIAKNLIEYVKDDYVSKIILQYSVASIFRYYLLNTKKIDLFPNLIVIGEKGFGKSARINLLFNQFLMGTDEFYTKDILKGSGIRLQKEGWTTMPMFIDELSEIPAQMYDVLKSIATSPRATIPKYTRSQERISYTLLRPLIIATNKVVISDDAFEDRCIIIPVSEKQELNERENAYIQLRDNIEHLGRAIYLKVEDMLNQLNEMEIVPKRSTAKKEIIRIGGELIKKFFREEFGLEYTPVDLAEEKESYIINSKDIIEEHILKEVRRMVKEINSTVSLPDLMNYDEDEDVSYADVRTNLAAYGIYIKYGMKEGRHFIGITSEGLKHLGLRKEFKIKSLRQLATELGTTRTTISHEYNTLSVVKIYLD